MNQVTLFAYLLLIAVSTSSLNVNAGQESQFNIKIPSLTGNIEIDGEFNETQWKHAVSTQITIETSPGENITAPVKTEVKLYSTDTSLFLAFTAHDPEPSQIRANLSDRDSVWGDDLVGIKLDTFNDSRLAYQFFVNAYGVQVDSIENELTGSESDAWDGIWYAASKRTATGYQVEIQLPFRVLNFDNAAQQKWGLSSLDSTLEMKSIVYQVTK